MTYEDYKNNGKYNCEQMLEISFGFGHGLSQEQIELYAKPEFKRKQMVQIRLGFKDGLSLKQVELYAKPEFSDLQMHEIYQGFKNGLSQEQIEFYADTKFKYDQMREIRYGFEDRLSMEQIEFYAKPEFSESQMDEIRIGFYDKLSKELVELYAKPEIDDYKMTIIRYFLTNADSKQVQQIKESIQAGLQYDQYFMYMNISIPAENMRVYKDMALLDMPRDDICTAIINNFGYEHIKFIKSCIKNEEEFPSILSQTINQAAKKAMNAKELKEEYYEQVATMLGTCYSITDINSFDMLKRCVEYDMSPSQLKLIASGRTSENMKGIAIAFLYGASEEDIKSVIDTFMNNKENIKEMAAAIAALRIRNSAITSTKDEINIEKEMFPEEER